MLTYDVIRRPVNTEKATIQQEKANQITLEVDRRANRVEIARAVEKLFKTRVAAVHTMQMAGKKKRVGRNVGKRRDWKKAIVTLMPGERIEFFDGV